MPTNLTDLTVDTHASLKDVMASLDKSAQGIVFVLDADQKLRGVLTDGDVRRLLLAGGTLNDTVANRMNQTFVVGSTSQGKDVNAALLSDRIRVLPLVDGEGRLVEFLRWADFYRLPIMEPVLQGREMEYVVDCLATKWISSQGKYVEQFQDAFSNYHSIAHALCVSNGTAALHLAMAAMEIGPGDEVLVPDLTFISPASMTLLCGATPVFVDVDRTTWTIDPRAIEAKITPRTKAIAVVHLYGHPCDMDPIMNIARKHGLLVIEDCAEALGAEYKGKKVGTIGDVGTFSFFANKVITTGEGGMVTTENLDLYNKMQLMRDHGMTRERRYWHSVAGFNYRLTNIQAAIGLAQLERIDEFLQHRVEMVARYNDQLGTLPGIELPPQEMWAKSIFWLYSVIVDETKSGISRDRLAEQLASYGIDTRPLFYPLHQQPPFTMQAGNSFPNTEWLASRGLSLPTSNNISMDEVDNVCRAIRSVIMNHSVS
jgi:perosamine synthetase